MLPEARGESVHAVCWACSDCSRSIRGGRSEALMMILVFPDLSVRRAWLAVARSSRGIGISVQSRLVEPVP